MARSATVTRSCIPLGSLTQRQSRLAATCPACGTTRVTALAMNLTDGTPVDFTSCRICAHRTWTHQGLELAVTDVLERTRKAG